MTKVIQWEPPVQRSGRENLKEFILYCRQHLALYEDQGGFEADVWYHFARYGRKHAIRFVRNAEKSNSCRVDILGQPFLDFSKAYVRYTQSKRPVTSAQVLMAALRAVHDALIDVHSEPNILLLDGLVQERTRNLVDLRDYSTCTRNQIGGKLEKLHQFLRETKILPRLTVWKNPWKYLGPKARRVDGESLAWQERRCPSLHQMITLADCFAQAKTLEDQYWSSVMVLLMMAPSRSCELSELTVDCLVERGGVLGVRWVGSKEFGETVKWVPEVMQPVVREAHRRLVKIGAPARVAAKFASKYPGKFMRHKACSTVENHGEDDPLDALQFAHAMNVGSESKLKRLERMEDRSSENAWAAIYPKSPKWLLLLKKRGITYKTLADHALNCYAAVGWPHLPGGKRPVYDALLIVREYEFHTNFRPRPFSWVQHKSDQLNAQLKPRSRLKNPLPTLFQRLGFSDEDGSEIELTSHQLRVWLSTQAERGGMDAWRLARWAGRTRIQDNEHYDLRTTAERVESSRALLEVTERPRALEAIKMNLPVAYIDIGVKRLGVVEVTEYGMCEHDFAMSPCTKGGECMTCKEHVCMKGIPKTLERIKLLEAQVADQFEFAKKAAQDDTYGSDKWVTHFGWKLAHIRAIRLQMESDDIPEGTIIRIPPEHDPSPIRRALELRGRGLEISRNNYMKQDKLAEIDNA